MIRPRTPRLRVLDCEIDAARRVVTQDGDGQARRLTPKALQVLLVLVERGGSVVSRETLFREVWPDTMPTDDVLTQAVTQLRKAFGDDRDAPRYIETIAKTGYRLLAPTAWLDDPAPLPPAHAPRIGDAGPPSPAVDAGPPAPAPAAPWHRRLPLPLVLALLVLVVAGGVWTLAAGDPSGVPAPDGLPAVPDLEYRAIASAPARERLPALSPDGATVAFVQSGADGRDAVMLQPVNQAAARALTLPAAGESDSMPVWSRDGTRIAFVRVSSGSCRFMLVPASGGEARAVGPCLQGTWSQFDWTPDGRGLVMGGPRADGGAGAPLQRLDLASGRWQPLAYAIGDGEVDQLPRYSPDGRLLVFRRNLSLADLWIMPAGGGTPRPLTRLRGDIRGWDWLPDGSGLVLSHVSGPSTLWLLRLSDGHLRPLPQPPVGNAVHPDIAADAWSMVFEVDQSRSGLFRVRLDDADAAPEPVFASSGADMLPSLSPDGRTIAFLSGRSMTVRLWLGEVELPATLRAVEGFEPVPRHPPAWSGDGRSLLVLGRTPEGEGLFEIDAGSGRVQKLPVPAARPVFAAYASQPDRLLLGVDDGRGRVRLVLYAREGWRELAAEDDVALARYDAASGAIVFTRSSAPGLWRADALLRGAVRISAELPGPQYYRHWGVHRGRAYSMAPEPDCATPWRPLESGEGGRCLAREGIAVGGSPAVDAQGRWLYLGLPLTENIDIGWTQLPQDLRAERETSRGMTEVMPPRSRDMTFGCATARCRHDFVLLS